MHWKYEADKNLGKRDAFKWTISRPGRLTDEPGTGKVSVGKTHHCAIPVRPTKRTIIYLITDDPLTVQRDDVAKGLALLIDREDAAGLALDIVGGMMLIEEALNTAIKMRDI
jgi:hypothetical protein